MTGLPLLVITTVDSRERALELGRAMVQRRLAACAQIDAIDSIYRWQGAVEHAPECRLLLKTHADGYAALEAALRELHPYELPAIHAIATVHAFAAYADWVEASTRPEPGTGVQAETGP